MGTIFRYDVYDGSSIVLENKTSTEIQEHLKTNYPNLSYYTTGKAYYQGIYLIVRHGYGQPKAPNRKKGDTRLQMPEEWIREWEEVCSRIRKYAAR